MSHFFNFDWRTYLALYPDVAAKGVLGRAKAYFHWWSHGRFEGRYFPPYRPPAAYPEERRIDQGEIIAQLKNRRIPVLFCFDMEPDDPPTEPGWDGARATIDLAESIRPQLVENTATQASFCWFWRLDPQITSMTEPSGDLQKLLGSEMERLQATGDEMGVHLHCYRPEPGGLGWQLDYADTRWVEECIESGFASYEKLFGRPPSANRFGDRWYDDKALAVVQRLGARYDLTAEPDVTCQPSSAVARGDFPDMRGLPTSPFRAPVDQINPPGGDPLWSIPITTGRPWVTRSRKGPVFSLNPALEPRLFRQIINTSLVEGADILTMVLTTKIMGCPLQRAVVEKNLRFVADHFAIGRMVATRPDEALSMIATKEN